jgi:hypothetical protein
LSIFVLAALVVLRIISAAMFAAAAGGLAAGAVSLGLTASPEWLRSISTFVLMLAVSFGIGAAGYSMMLPSRAELLRRTPGSQQPSMPPALIIVIAALAAVAVWQVPALMAWWSGNLALAGDLIGGGPDPIGLDIIPKVLVLSTPILASAGLTAFVMTSVLALSAPSGLVSRVLTACVLLQGGLVGGLHAHERAIRTATSAVQALVNNDGDATASAQVAGWLSRYDSAAVLGASRLVWLLAGYALALVMARVLAPERPPTSAPAFGAGTDAVPIPAPARPPAITVARPASAPLPDDPGGAAEFDYSTYSVRPRRPWHDPLVWRYTEYDIASIPPMARARFSFSWRTGTIRREPNGPDLLSVRALGGGLPGRRSYGVSDSRTGHEIGTLVPVGSDWEARDASRAAVAHVLEIERRAGRAQYVAKNGEREICRFVWGFMGMTVSSAELQIEFLGGADARFSRALAIAIGPILEHRARRSSQWRS